MRNFVFLFVMMLIFTSCSIEDDGTRIEYEFAEVTEADLPESFEKGKTYEIDITYVLPSACHTASGINAIRGSSTGVERRDIYVVGISSYNAIQTECNRDDENLERENSFSIHIDENDPYTFYLWSGLNEDLENQYNVVEVPVVE